VPLIVTSAGPGPSGPPASTGPQPLNLVYTDPDGTDWDLVDRSGGSVALALSGIGGLLGVLSSIGLPGGGGIPQSYTPAVRTIILGMLLEESTQGEFLASQDRWARAIWTQRQGLPAPGTLTVQRPDGTARQLQVFCTAGSDQADDDRAKSGLTWAAYTLTWTALNPYWNDRYATTLQFASPSGSGGVPPMPPVLLDPSTVLGTTTVVNDGDADAWPVWTLTGPGTPTLTNTTTGLSFGLDVALSAGEVVTVDTRPTMQSAVDGLDANRWADLTRANPRSLWQLVPGTNLLNLQMTGSTSATVISMSYTRRWLRS
jgi:hypothetical protein